MDTIKNYLENMFSHLPQSKEILKIKNEMLSNMEEKYQELIQSGKTENEAIGIVISEFGNINELLKEMGIEQSSNNTDILVITESEALDFVEASRKTGIIVGIGVFLCIIGGASMILVNQLIDDGFISVLSEDMDHIISLIPLFILVATAVGLFIYSDSLTRRFHFVKDEFILSESVRNNLNQRKEAFHPIHTLSIIIGVVLCILSPIILFITSIIGDSAAVYGIVALLFIVGIAVYIFIYFGSIDDSYKKLLNVDVGGEPVKTKEYRTLRAVEEIIWPLAVCIFIITGIVYNLWRFNWIIFPITRLIYSMFSQSYKIMKEKD